MKIRRPDDFHVHFRSGDRLRDVAPWTAKLFGRALVMPNLTPPVSTAEDVMRYRSEIVAATEAFDFAPLMTIKLGTSTTPDTVLAAKRAGVVAAKFYPEGATTNAAGGHSTLAPFYPVLNEMEKAGMVLSLHGERPDAFSLDREVAFLSDLHDVVEAFPGLRIVLEHITTAAAVQAVSELPKNVGATITPHHLFLTLDDVIGGSLNPHAFCKPIAKRPGDRAALVRAAVGGNPKFFFGSDTAPHTKDAKLCQGCAGVYCAPTALESLAEVFEQEGALDRLEAFTSTFGANFYGLPWNSGSVVLEKRDWVVPDTIDGIVPFRAGETLRWSAWPTE